MKTIEIISGNFTEAGNYSAYDEDGNRMFVFKRVMENQGWLTDADVKLPFYAKVVSKPIGQLDANGDTVVDTNGVAVTTLRDTVTRIYESRQQVIDSAVNKLSLDIEIQKAVQEQATTAGLSQTRVNALLDAI